MEKLSERAGKRGERKGREEVRTKKKGKDRRKLVFYFLS